MFIPKKKTASIVVDKARIPRVYIGKEAITKMELYVDICSDEVGWLGTAEMGRDEEGVFVVIHDTFLVEQEAHATTTELTPEGLTKLATEILMQPGGDKQWNSMRVWGHSHVNMGTSPSGQDDTQMKEFQTIGHDWFIRLIANKKGDIRIDLFDYANGIKFLDMEWEAEDVADDDEAIAIDEQIKQRYAELEALEKMLDDKRKAHVTSMKPFVAEEIKVKVKKKTYAAVGSRGKYNYQTQRWEYPTTPSAAYQNYSSYHDTRYPSYYPHEDELPLSGYGSERSSTAYGTNNNSPVFIAHSIEPVKPHEVKSFFSDEECVEISKLRDEEELADYFEDWGFAGTFTLKEAVGMWHYAVQHYSKYQGA